MNHAANMRHIWNKKAGINSPTHIGIRGPRNLVSLQHSTNVITWHYKLLDLKEILSLQEEGRGPLTDKMQDDTFQNLFN